MTTTLNLARFAAGAPVPERVIEAVAAGVPPAADGPDPADAAAYWVTCAVLAQVAARDAGRREKHGPAGPGRGGEEIDPADAGRGGHDGGLAGTVRGGRENDLPDLAGVLPGGEENAPAAPRPEQEAGPALAVGLEIALRLLASLDRHVAGGWDPVCAAVVVGAAAGAARASGLDDEATVRAIGIAATQASGLSAVASSPLGRFQRRHAARDGRQAAELARAGMTAPATGLEGRRGLYALIAPDADPAAAVVGLGRTWLVTGRARPGHDRARAGTGLPGHAPPAPEERWTAALRHATEVLS